MQALNPGIRSDRRRFALRVNAGYVSAVALCIASQTSYPAQCAIG